MPTHNLDELLFQTHLALGLEDCFRVNGWKVTRAQALAIGAQQARWLKEYELPPFDKPPDRRAPPPQIGPDDKLF